MRSSPIQVGSGFYRSLSLGNNSTMAIDPYGTLSAWGENLYGQIGTNSITSYSWTQLSNGNAHSLALRSDNTLWAWGFNGQGQLGQSDTIARQSPTQILGSWASVSAGSSHTLGIKSDSTLWAWGTNGSGQLGLTNINDTGDIITRSSPVQVGTNSWTAVATGLNFTIAIKNDNTLYSWGLNTGYQLGLGVIASRSSPTQIGTSSYIQISSGASHSLAIDSNNQLYGWGFNTSGQVGNVPISWAQIASANGGSTNNMATYAIRSDGRLYAWGKNTNGQVGDNTVISRSSPVQIGTDSWTFVAAGEQSAFAIRNDYTLWGWGFGAAGGLGLNDVANRSSPVQIFGGGSWSTVGVMGGPAAIGIKIDGTLWSWGNGVQGVLGIGNTANRSAPVQVGASSWLSVASGGQIHALAIDANRRLFAWGFNTSGQLGDNTVVAKSSPVLVTGGYSWNQVTAMFDNSAGITTDGKLFTWGNNTSGQLGIGLGTTANNRSNPVQVASPTSFTMVTGNNYGSSFQTFMIGIATTGALYAWGNNAFGSLGDGTTINRSAPVQIGLLTNWTRVASSIAINSTNQLYAWGFNNDGQLGISNIALRSSPVQVGTDIETFVGTPYKIGTSSWSTVSAGYSHSAAITSDNRLFTWGDNTVGQLGTTMSFTSLSAGDLNSMVVRSDGSLWVWGVGVFGGMGDNTTVSRSSPGQLGTNNNWSKVLKGGESLYAIDTLGKLYGWGQNNIGQLGVSDTINRSSPVQIGTNSWVMISNFGDSTGFSTTVLAIRSDGALFAWGSNAYGQIGDNANSLPKSSPVQIGTSSWSTVSAGFQFTMGITTDGKLYGWGNNNVGQLGTTSAFTWSKIVTRGTHALAIRSDNRLFAWGLNSSGQLGLGDTINRSSPVFVASGSYTQISAGVNSSYAIRSDGSLWSWGNNSDGQLGDPTVTTLGRSSPVQVGSNSWSTVSASKSLTYVLATTSTNNLFAWGLNTAGHLGVGDYFNRSSPTQVSGGGSWTAISAGGAHSLAIKSDFKLYTWGLGTAGQTAQAGTTFSWTQVATGNLFSLAIRSDGLLFAWGLNTEGEMGDGSTVSKSSPVQIGASSWSQIAAGATHTLAVRVDGTLWAWGVNNAGQLGQSDVVWRSSPVQIGSSTNWSKVAASQSQSFAIDTTSSLYAWGLNTNGRLGVGNTLSRSSPVQVATPVVSWSQVAAGASFTGGIDVLGRLYTWGFNTQGQLGGAGAAATTGSTISRSSPSQVGASSWSFVAAGFNAMAGIASTGGLFTWGNNSLGELGDNNLVAVVRSSPVQVGTSSWTSVTASSMNSAGGGQMLAITTANALWGWGQNVWGSIGDGTTVAKSSMVAVTGGGTYVKASAGPASLAITTTTFSLQGWGNNQTYGAIGDITLVARSAPVQIGTSIPTVLNAPAIIGTSSWTSVSAGGSFSMAIRTDSGLFAWGSNPSGQLGLTNINAGGDTVNRSSPVQIGTSSWSQVSAGDSHTMALRYLDGGLFTWGLGNPGQLGSGLTTSRSSPVQVGTSSWISVDSGLLAGAGIDITNNIYAWGLGTSGQLGDNTAVTKSTPTKIGTLQSAIEYSPIQVGSSSWSQVSAGNSHAVGIEIDNTVFAWGLNTAGQLGNTSTVSRSSPVQVGTATNSLTNANAYSGYFNGSSSITGPTNISAFQNTNTQSWTIECWIYLTNTAGVQGVIGYLDSGLVSGWMLLAESGGSGANISYNQRNGGATGNKISSAAGSVVSNQWYHIAAVYDNSGSTIRMYLNGISIGTTTHNIATSATQSLVIGNYIGASNSYFNGYISNIRIVRGTAVYTTSFTVPATPLTAVTNTALLTLQNTTLIDNSTNAYTISIGDGTPNLGSLNTPFPSAIAAGALFATQISAGSSHTGAIDTTGKLYIWGLGSYGQLGGGTTTARSAPTQIGIDKNWKLISAGSDNTLAIDYTEALFAWGVNNQGQLGIGDTAFRSSPVQLSSMSLANLSSPMQIGSSSYSLVSTGNNTTAAISSDNKLFVWGLGTTGQLGTGVTFSRSSPVQISTNSYNLVSAGGTHTTFVPNYSPQLILSTGLNTSGQLGSADIISRSSPTQVAASTSKFNSPVTVSVGDYSSYYVSSPTQVGTSSWTQVSAGGTHTLGVKKDNTLYAWGYNANGQLGGSSTINRSSPVQIGTSSWNQVSAGDLHNTIAKSDGTINTFGLNSFGQLGDGT